MRRPVTSIWPSSEATSARARLTASSYGRGSMTNKRSPCFTAWLSTTCSSTIVPLTCGTTPMVSANTIASSVCGCSTTRRTTTTASTTAPATTPSTISRPKRLRTPFMSARKHDQPGGQRPQQNQTRVQDGCGAEIRSNLRQHERLMTDDREDHADDDADQPRRKERPQDIDRRYDAASGEEERSGPNRG